MKRLKRLAAFTAAQKWIRMVSGWGIWGATSFYYDKIVYPGLMLWLGSFWGGIAAASGAMVICIGFLLYYEFTKSVWVKSADEILNKLISFVERAEKASIVMKLALFIPRVFTQFCISRISQRGFLGFITLSCMSDPFITISYFRIDRRDRLTLRDWTLFTISGVIANTYWIFYIAIILIPFRFILRLIVH